MIHYDDRDDDDDDNDGDDDDDDDYDGDDDDDDNDEDGDDYEDDNDDDHLVMLLLMLQPSDPGWLMISDWLSTGRSTLVLSHFILRREEVKKKLQDYLRIFPKWRFIPKS